MTTTRARSKQKKTSEPSTAKKSGARVVGGEIVRKPAKKKKEEPKKAKKKGAKSKKRVFTAKSADRHELYQLAVQSPEEDVKFLRRVYKTYRKKPAQHFREDFCGTGLLMSHWVKSSADFSAEGFDIDPDPVAWGLEHNFDPIGEAASRVTIHLKDVREKSLTKPDIRSAQNFSYFVFKERQELLEYCKSAYEDLADDGIFIMDIYGGPEAIMEMEEVRKVDEGFTYVWDQDEYWPATGDYKTYIHFRFKDGTELKKAFRYDWRFWHLTEVRDVLLEAGFPLVESYWEGTDEDGESGNGIFRKSKKGENCEAWITYLIGVK